jgi:inosose dehydratase
MKFGVADYGMNVWEGGLYNIEDRLIALKEIGFNGTERLEACCPSEAIAKSAMYRKLGMDYATCRGPNVQVGIEWTAALGKEYVWLTPGQNDRKIDFEVFCRRSRTMCKAAASYGVKVAIHNHMHQRIENQQEFEDFMKAVPEAGVVFDTGHLSMAGGDPVEIIHKYHDRICVMHLKDVFLTGEEREDGIPGYRFCELGSGNNGFDNADVVKALLEVGYDGWIFIEHDQHLREPLEDLTTSINYVKAAMA